MYHGTAVSPVPSLVPVPMTITVILPGTEGHGYSVGSKGIEGILGMECTPLAMVCELG